MYENQVEEYLNSQLGLDDIFYFKCRGCGKCCKQREDVLLTSRDLYNMAKKLGITIETAIDTYCEAYIGNSSRMPIVRILPRGVNNACPFLKDKRCSIHEAKPVICAMYPVGRMLVAEDMEKGISPGAPIKAGYILNPVTCGSIKKKQTVRSWLERFGIPIEDEFYILWNELIMFISSFLREIETAGAPDDAMQPIHNMVFHYMYIDYDMGQEFMAQFKTNKAKLMQNMQMLKDGLKRDGLM